MRDILIIAHYIFFDNESGNSRFRYIAEHLGLCDENRVEVVSSSFSHIEKRQRNIQLAKIQDCKTTLLYEPGYKRNVSLYRFYSHFVFGKNLKKYLNNRKPPDVIYCAVPSLDVAYVSSVYAKKNGIRFILDIQDLWPEAFEMIFRVPIIKDIIFYPIKYLANKIYASADEIVAVSETYVKRAISTNKKLKIGYGIFLGTDIVRFDQYIDGSGYIKKEMDEIWIAYVGTLGHSYDLTSVFQALEQLKNNVKEKKVKFIVMGDGPLKGKFEDYVKEKKLDVKFLGRLPYNKMVTILTKCDIAVNPISHGAAQSIINKVGDYAAAGLPIINTQECEEYRKLVEKYQCGINCENGNSISIANAIYKLCIDKDLRETMGRGNRRLAEEKFNREITYKHIYYLIEGKNR